MRFRPDSYTKSYGLDIAQGQDWFLTFHQILVLSMACTSPLGYMTTPFISSASIQASCISAASSHVNCRPSSCTRFCLVSATHFLTASLLVPPPPLTFSSSSSVSSLNCFFYFIMFEFKVCRSVCHKFTPFGILLQADCEIGTLFCEIVTLFVKLRLRRRVKKERRAGQSEKPPLN